MVGQFPKIQYGICPVCGNRGGDDASPSAADAPLRDLGTGVPLEYYQGQLMCELCKKQKQADEESIISADKHAEEERFRGSAGFKRSV